MFFQDESDLLKEYEEIVIVEDNKPIDVDEEQGNLLRGIVNCSGVAICGLPGQQFQRYFLLLSVYKKDSEYMISIQKNIFPKMTSNKSCNFKLFCFLINCVFLRGEYIETTLKL